MCSILRTTQPSTNVEFKASDPRGPSCAKVLFNIYDDVIALISPKRLVRGLRHALGSVKALYRDGKVLISPKHLVRVLRHELGSV